MEFSLVYHGPLKANGSIRDKQDIRREFHKQLLELWKKEPLSSLEKANFDSIRSNNMLPNTVSGHPILFTQRLFDFLFKPLVSSKFNLVAELDIIFLRPESPGCIITQGGDIDNRLKTLFDAFRMPKESKEIPKDDSPKPNENPFYCLLEDDNLITKVAVRTDRLLKQCNDPSFVELLIAVRTTLTKMSWDNIDLG
jgi:hypothetical protein